MFCITNAYTHHCRIANSAGRERVETRTPAAQGATGKPPNTEAARQGEAPEVQPRGSALPP